MVDIKCEKCGKTFVAPDTREFGIMTGCSYCTAIHISNEVGIYELVQGRKNDKEKDRWELMQYAFITEVCKVITFGAIKYAPDNWKEVPNGRARYFAASIRHILAWWGGERNDPESGLHHLAHVGCCLMFLFSLEVE